MRKKNQIKKQVDIWNDFTQLISILKKLFKICCKVCHKLLNHSITQDNFNITNMKKHFVTQKCYTRKRLNSTFQTKLLLQRISNLK